MSHPETIPTAGQERWRDQDDEHVVLDAFELALAALVRSAHANRGKRPRIVSEGGRKNDEAEATLQLV